MWLCGGEWSEWRARARENEWCVYLVNGGVFQLCFDAIDNRKLEPVTGSTSF